MTPDQLMVLALLTMASIAMVVTMGRQLATSRRAHAKTSNALETQMAALRQVSERLDNITVANDELTRINKKLAEATDAVVAQKEVSERALKEAERKVEELAKAIGGVCDERDLWTKKYQTMAVQYGNGQDLMLREIQRLAQALSAKGIKVKLPKVIGALCEDFQVTHVQPAMAASVAKPDKGLEKATEAP